MRAIVTGGRDYADREMLFHIMDGLDDIHSFETIVHGGASGADRLAGEWAIARDIEVEVHLADWKMHGSAAGPIRNQTMLETCPDLVIAFPGGRGTADMVSRAKRAGIRVIEVSTDGI